MVGSLGLSWDTDIYQPVWRFIQSDGGSKESACQRADKEFCLMIHRCSHITSFPVAVCKYCIALELIQLATLGEFVHVKQFSIKSIFSAWGFCKTTGTVCEERLSYKGGASPRFSATWESSEGVGINWKSALASICLTLLNCTVPLTNVVDNRCRYGRVGKKWHTLKMSGRRFQVWQCYLKENH